jgi:hypothetical protein
MPISARIVDGEGLTSAELVKRDDKYGVVVATTPLLVSFPVGRPLLNETFGSAMNQNVSFSGTPEKIHDGTDSVLWTGAAGAGTWDFADTTDPQAGTKHISITSANNNDIATFTDATETNMSNYTSITGQVQLVSNYDPTTNSILLRFQNNGVFVGVAIDLNNYIDTGLTGAYQSFIIPKVDMQVDDVTVDQLDITITKSSGQKPTIYFDTIQIEEVGNPLVYGLRANQGTRFRITEIVFTWVDVGTGGTAYAYNKLGAISRLANGLVFSATVGGKVIFSTTINQLSDLLRAGGLRENLVDDGTNTLVSVAIHLFESTPIVLDYIDDDEISVTVNDDISGLLEFTTFVRGHEEVL